jgi:hypothetical protein
MSATFLERSSAAPMRGYDTGFNLFVEFANTLFNIIRSNEVVQIQFQKPQKSISSRRAVSSGLGS